jgi:hypothetical protein
LLAKNNGNDVVAMDGVIHSFIYLFAASRRFRFVKSIKGGWIPYYYFIVVVVVVGIVVQFFFDFASRSTC